MASNTSLIIIQARRPTTSTPKTTTTTDVLPSEILDRLRQENHQLCDVQQQEEETSKIIRSSDDSTHTTCDSQDSGLRASDFCWVVHCPLKKHGCLRVATLAESLQEQTTTPMDDPQQATVVVSPSCLCDDPFLPHNHNKSVRFDTVEIHEHASILGCNPGGTGGPPLTICWRVLRTQILPLDDYEATRGPRRSDLFLRSSQAERVRLLRESGCDKEEIARAEALAGAIRASRDESSRERSELQALLRESRRGVEKKTGRRQEAAPERQPVAKTLSKKIVQPPLHQHQQQYGPRSGGMGVKKARTNYRTTNEHQR